MMMMMMTTVMVVVLLGMVITFVTVWVVVSAIGGNEIQSLALTDHHRLPFGKIEMTGDLN